MLPFLLKDCKGSDHFHFHKTILKIIFYFFSPRSFIARNVGTVAVLVIIVYN